MTQCTNNRAQSWEERIAESNKKVNAWLAGVRAADAKEALLAEKEVLEASAGEFRLFTIAKVEY